MFSVCLKNNFHYNASDYYSTVTAAFLTRFSRQFEKLAKKTWLLESYSPTLPLLYSDFLLAPLVLLSLGVLEGHAASLVGCSLCLTVHWKCICRNVVCGIFCDRNFLYRLLTTLPETLSNRLFFRATLLDIKRECNTWCQCKPRPRKEIDIWKTKQTHFLIKAWPT